MKEKIDILLNNKVNEGKIPGANYAVINKENVIFGSIGNKQIYNEEDCKNEYISNHIIKNDINTLYDLASLSKVISTNTIISRMIYKGLIKESDKVKDYLTDYKYDTTIKELLNHSSGLPADIKVNVNDDKNYTLKRIYDVELEYEPCTKSIYSDIGFILLGLIIEKIYNKSLDEVAYEEVFKPIHMNNTCYNPKNIDLCAPTEYDDRGLVRGKVHDEKSYVLGGIAGHAGVFSNVEDLVKFAKMILNDGIVDNEVYLPLSEINKWFLYEKYTNTDENYKSFRSNGWIVGDWNNLTAGYGDEDTILHTGFTGTSITINRKNKIATILLTNRIHPTRNNSNIPEVRKDFYTLIAEELFLKISTHILTLLI